MASVSGSGKRERKREREREKRAISLEATPNSKQQTANMLFMVIERFKDPDAVKARFAERGRMMPDGVSYINSWIETDGKTCYQVMEAPSMEALEGWTQNWDDIVDFEVITVMTSSEFNQSKRG